MSQTPDPAAVGQQLASRREELDLTQEALARRIGISTPTVSVTERGHTRIRVSKRSAWEGALGLKAGTISRAYRDGTALELADPAEEQGSEPYADMSDRLERTAWEMPLDIEQRKLIVDMLREAKARGAEGRRSA
jgi:transcriptional regulator with XRE-family HTH domain